MTGHFYGNIEFWTEKKDKICPLTGCYFDPWYVRSGVGVSAGRIGSTMNRFYIKQTKNVFYFISSKSSDKTFCGSKDKFRGHLIYEEGSGQCVSKPIMGQTGCETETRRTINQMLILWSFICCNWSSYCTFLTVNIFGSFVSELLFPTF